MPVKNTHYLDVDTKLTNYISVPRVTQNDDVFFIVRILDDGRPVSLTSVQTFLLASLKPNKETILTVGTVSGDEISFKIESAALNVKGRVQAAVQLYYTDGRTSTIPFYYEVIADSSVDYVPDTSETSLIQLVLGDAPFVIEAAQSATIEAEDAAAQTLEALDNFDTEKSVAIQELDDVKEDNRITWKQEVATVVLRDSTYPNPQIGDTVRITGEARIDRFNGTEWITTDRYNPVVVDELTGKLAETGERTLLSKDNVGIELVNKSVSSNESALTLQDLDENGIVYAYEGNKILKSTNNGTTFTTIHTFAKPVVAVKHINNGKLIVGIGSSDVGTEVYTGSGSTWNKVVQMSVGARIVSGWGISIHENIIVLCEYGNQSKALLTYLSTDYGNTFKVIFDFSEYAPFIERAHTHGAIYDKYFDRIWVATGDGYVGGVDNNNLFYSDDMGETWIATNTPNQLLNMYALEDRVVFTGDSVPNVLYAYERGDKNEIPVLKPVYWFDQNHLKITMLVDTLYKRNDQSPLLLSFVDEAEPDGYFQKVLATYNGKDYFDIWTNDRPQTSVGHAIAIGPTNENKVMISFSGDGRYTGSSAMLKADMKVNRFKFAGKSVRNELMNNNNIIDIRDLGVYENYPSRQTKEFAFALNHCIDNGKTLLIPKGMEIFVESINIRNKNDISIMCYGKVSFVEKASGTTGNVIGFENCHNIRIYEFNTDGLKNIPLGSQILHNILSFTGCTNVKIDYIKAQGVSGYLYNFENTQYVEIGETIVNGNDEGAGVFKIINSSDIHIQSLKSRGVGLFGNYSSLIFNILAEGMGKRTERVTIDYLEVESASRKLMVIDAKNDGILSNILIRKIKAFTKSTMTLSDTNWVSVNNGTEIEINGEFLNRANKPLDAIDFKKASRLRSKLLLNGFKNALTLGKDGELIKAIIQGVIKNSTQTPLLIGVLKNSDVMNLELTDNALGSATALSNIANTGTLVTANWENVVFRNVQFGKGAGNFAACVSAYSTTAVNVVFEDCDFSEWSTSPLSTIFSTGAVGFIRRTNRGVNYRSAKPTGMYSNVGEVVYNSAPTASGFTGWVCTAAGSPGTWKGFGLIEA